MAGAARQLSLGIRQISRRGGGSGDVIWIGELADAMPLILTHHYSHRRCADPRYVFLEGQPPAAAAVFAAPTNRVFGPDAIELVRLVRTPGYGGILSAFVGVALRVLRRERAASYVLAYADSGAGHHGGIYQALNFAFVGTSPGHAMMVNDATGQVVSARAFDQRSPNNKAGFRLAQSAPKYLYVLPLTLESGVLLRRFGWRRLAYPKPHRGVR